MKQAYRLAVPAVLVILLGAWRVWATDPPHDLSRLPQGCADCHDGHNAPGLGLTQKAGNANLCMSCHAVSTARGFGSWQTEDQAIPGTSGTLHRFDAAAVNPTYGAESPTATAMATRLDGGKLMCSTCHDQHNATRPGGRAFASSVAKTADGGGTASLTVDPPADAASARRYLIEIRSSSPGASFRISNDGGISFYGWDGSAWVPGSLNGRGVGASLALNDGNNVAVTFGADGPGAFLVGDRFEFDISKPFLRIGNTASAMCVDCHRSRVMTAASIESGGDGVKVFSHPVGEALSKSYDRTGAVLDANGAVQGGGSADTNATNDLLLDATNKVHCMSCHQPHGADSNSLTEDPR